MLQLQYLLDTNICIHLMDEQPPPVVQRFAAYRRGQIAISTITWAELCCGMGKYQSEMEMQQLFSMLNPQPFDLKAAEMFGERTRRFPAGKSSFDRMIAAHALALDVVLVSNNVDDFKIYQKAGLKIESWIS
ncbi:VapC toxin family PIN domain ribonuclease [Lysobacteraceae bacterium NML120232]|nr:VapC toxin family PIN domain ribonuclease [Xanthomonadaceae bacterium NML120232]